VIIRQLWQFRNDALEQVYPDLPRRLRGGLSLNSYRWEAFCYGGVKGYLDYPTFDELETTAVE